MIRLDLKKWNQTPEELRRLATESPHPRTRERFLALYMIASGQTNATRWAKEIGREDESVINWVHKYNESGPSVLTYRRTGGHAPLLEQARSRR
jgi:transposase